jgi:hypothetical protein
VSAAVGRALGLVVALVVVLAGVLVPSASAQAAGSVSVDVVGRSGTGAVADPDYLTELTLSGTGFQGIRNGHGGIYVFFGTVNGSWRPSQGGTTGENYRYVYDDESNPVGYQLFVAFEGASTGYAANGGTVDSSTGAWSATIKVPGARFQAYDRDNDVTTVDCTQVQCGIITVGAHGVTNANNETFTPVRFESLYSGAAAPAAPAAPSPGDGTGSGSAGSASGSATPGEAAPAEAESEVGQEPEPTPSASVTQAPEGDADPDATDAPLTAEATASGSAAPLVVVGVLGALLLAAIGFTAWALVRARRGARAEPAE